MKRLFASIIISLTLSLFLSPTNSIAVQATLAWDPPDISTDVTGYMLHYGTASGTYLAGLDVGNTTSCAVSNLIDGQTYYFAVAAYNAAGDQSEYSNEVSKMISPLEYPLLTILNTDPELGTVSGSGIDCGNTCLAIYKQETVVSLSATANPRSTFDGWSGGGCSGTGLCKVIMNANANITAKFISTSTIDYSIIASVNGQGGTISPAGALSVSSGSSQTFSITPAAGYLVARVTVDRKAVDDVNSYTFSNVAANHKIDVSFRKVR